MNGGADQDSGFCCRVAKRLLKHVEPDLGRQFVPVRHRLAGQPMMTTSYGPAGVHQHLRGLHHRGDASRPAFPHDRHWSLKAVLHGKRTLPRRARFRAACRKLFFQDACLQCGLPEEFSCGFGESVAVEHVTACPAGGHIFWAASLRPVIRQNIDGSGCIAHKATRGAMLSSIDADGSAPGSNGHDSAERRPVTKVPSGFLIQKDSRHR